MKICISQDETGQISVGEMPEDMAAGDDYLQPVQTIDEAFELARRMLSGDDRSAEQATMDGYNKSKPAAAASGRPTPQAVFGDSM